MGNILSKTLGATGMQITVTATATSLKDLIQTADATVADSFFNEINYVVLQPLDGNIRYSDIGTPTGTNGSLLFETVKEPIEADPRKLKLIRKSTETGNISVQIVTIGINN